MAESTCNSSSTVFLYRFIKDPNLFCTSPFVNKIEALMVFSGIKDLQFRAGNPLQAPRRMLPFIELNGQQIPDSELIYETLIERGIVQCLDEKAGLDDRERAISTSIRSFVERELYELIVYERWIVNYQQTKEAFLVDVPAFLRSPVAYFFVWRPNTQRFWLSGLSRLTDQERARDTKRFVVSVSTLVPQKGYIMGKSEPTRVDATIWGFLTGVYRAPQLCPKIAAEVHSYPHLAEYHRLLSLKFWPERKPIV
ncbi:SubName: Full=Uncharacterized protein {ECO:0000313/EMBL:CCA70086.1} [Serendipita indica DSM 11827]|nr:SubName: Full=Uncharacterized protein {ECO:0000313/EMBL:CCA70086.1} [Serendipita indica DSM 11827]